MSGKNTTKLYVGNVHVQHRREKCFRKYLWAIRKKDTQSFGLYFKQFSFKWGMILTNSNYLQFIALSLNVNQKQERTYTGIHPQKNIIEICLYCIIFLSGAYATCINNNLLSSYRNSNCIAVIVLECHSQKKDNDNWTNAIKIERTYILFWFCPHGLLRSNNKI